jgi:glycerol-3-phosphate O-acyltransferase
LQQELSLLTYANSCLTLFWRPLKDFYRHLICALNRFYRENKQNKPTIHDHIWRELKQGNNILLNLSITRDYLFGLIRSNPLTALSTIIDIQKQMDKPIHLVTLQFLYDKHPQRLQRSYFDLLFGEKSRPGGIRKFILFVMHYFGSTRIKVGEPIHLQSFLAGVENLSVEESTRRLKQRIEDDLIVEHARITGARLKSREAALQDILKQEQLATRLDELSQETGRPLERCRKRITRYLKEIAANVNYSYIQFAHVTLGYLWNHIYDGVVVKRDQLNQIRAVAGRHPVVLVPMHRSHIDYLLVSDLFYEHDITFPHICSGINLNFWPIGPLIKKCGGFFIRRKFGQNPIYKEAVYQYLKFLLSGRHCVEFFIEGTRSRTGKMNPPKMGILSLIMRAYFEGACEDISFIPTAVVYEQIPEQRAYVDEAAGREKKKESPGQFIKARKVLKKRFGKVFIEFAEPVSFRQYCAQNAIQSASTDDRRSEVKAFAYHLTYHMNKIAVVTPTALVSLAILSLGESVFTEQQIIDRVRLLRAYLNVKQVNESDLLRFSDHYAFVEAIKKLQKRGLLRGEGETLHLEDKNRIELDYAKNNIVHFFVSLVCFCKSLRFLKDEAKASLSEVVAWYEKVKTFLRHDFIFSERATIEEHVERVIDFCVTRGFVSFSSGELRKTLTHENRAEFLAFEGLLDNFFEAQFMVLSYCRLHAFEDVEKKALAREILNFGAKEKLPEKNRFPEALSRFNIESALRVLVDLSLLTTRSDEAEKTRYTRVAGVEIIDGIILSIQSLCPSVRS